MRISDWSSDVCSSDLSPEAMGISAPGRARSTRHVPVRLFCSTGRSAMLPSRSLLFRRRTEHARSARPDGPPPLLNTRQSIVGYSRIRYGLRELDNYLTYPRKDRKSTRLNYSP